MTDDPLANIQQAQGVQDNADLNDAVRNQQWSNAFVNTPPAEVLRSNLNLTNTMDRVVRNRMALAAQTDAKALDLSANTAKFQEYQRQAPIREQLLQAHIDATGATERRKAAEAISQANDTAGLNSDIANAYKNGLKPGTPDFQEAAFTSIAAHPHADAVHIREFHKIAGGAEDVDPVAHAQEGMRYKQAALDAGFKNPRLRTVGGKWTVDEGPVTISEEDRLKNKVAEVNAVEEARNAAHPQHAPADKIAATEDLMVNAPLSLSFGHIKDGKLVQDTGDTKATHVNVSFVGPSGKIHYSGPITIDEYQKLQDRVKGRKSAAPITDLTQANDPNFDQTDPDAGKGTKEVIVRNGKSYEVDHATKSVRPL